MIRENLPQDDFSSQEESIQNPSGEWLEEIEGKLSVDILDTGKDIRIVATVAGAVLSSLEIYVQNDLVTIRGKREMPYKPSVHDVYYHKECFWGVFSRTVVLPVHVKGYLAKATYKYGILIITVPKEKETASIPITIEEE